MINKILFLSAAVILTLPQVQAVEGHDLPRSHSADVMGNLDDRDVVDSDGESGEVSTPRGRSLSDPGQNTPARPHAWHYGAPPLRSSIDLRASSEFHEFDALNHYAELIGKLHEEVQEVQAHASPEQKQSLFDAADAMELAFRQLQETVQRNREVRGAQASQATLEEGIQPHEGGVLQDSPKGEHESLHSVLVNVDAKVNIAEKKLDAAIENLHEQLSKLTQVAELADSNFDKK